jgi:hypothetical protein
VNVENQTLERWRVLEQVNRKFFNQLIELRA